MLFVGLLASTINAQSEQGTAGSEDEPKVCISQQTADRCSQAFDEVRALRLALEAERAEKDELKRRARVDEEIKREQRELIQLLQKQRGTTVSFLWGLIKVKKVK